jgi:selenocysteine-specific elongation factor
MLARAKASIAGPVAVSTEALTELENTLVSFTSVYVANHPLEAGVSLQTLRKAAKANRDVIEFALARLEKKGRIELSGSIVRPAGWQSRLDDQEQAASDSILHDICIAAAEPPSVGDLEQKYGRNTSGLLRRLERAGQIQRVADDRYYGSESVSKMVGTLRTRLVRGRKYTPAELKEVLGVTRKYLIPFLEFCDRTGVTERGSDGRQLKELR